MHNFRLEMPDRHSLLVVAGRRQPAGDVLGAAPPPRAGQLGEPVWPGVPHPPRLARGALSAVSALHVGLVVAGLRDQDSM